MIFIRLKILINKNITVFDFATDSYNRHTVFDFASDSYNRQIRNCQS